MLKTFVVEDNEWYNKFIVHNLSLDPEMEVKSFLTGKELLDQLHQNPDVITLDFRLPDLSGKEVLKRIKDYNQNIEVIIISEQDNMETAIELLKAGAYDYLIKGPDIKKKLFNTLNHIRKSISLKSKLSYLEQEVGKKYEFQKLIIGNCQPIKQVFSLIEKASTNNISVVITGETGTGKELVAKAIHYNSKIKKKPFIPINVAAIPSELIESELFGHEKGAFTGASFTRIGKFEEANGGTIFLDEIGEMEITMQAKLLRVLQEKELTKVGSNKTIKVDCRIIAATNKNLKEEIKKGNFREDLYYRLWGMPIHLPRLKERGNDIILLATAFVKSFCQENELPLKLLDNSAKKKLLNYSYPGNIRELKSIVELAVVMANEDTITAEDITLSTEDDPMPEILSQDTSLKEFNRRIIEFYLRKNDENIHAAAETLKISPSTIYRMLKDQKD